MPDSRQDAKAPEPTHAGGVVYRFLDGDVEFLLVTAKRTPQQWVLPKGHIERGESPAQTAVREVLEETGIEATVRESLGFVEFERARDGDRESVCAQYFLMEFRAVGQPSTEGRSRRWLPLTPTLKELRYDDAKRLVKDAKKAVDRLGTRARS